MKTIKVSTKINVPGPAGYLLWLRQDLPPVYAALVAKFPAVAHFDGVLRNELAVRGLGFDWSTIGDALSSAASGVGSALSSVGSYVASNTPAILATGAGIYGLVVKQQVLDSQLSAAQRGGYPAQTGVVQMPGNAPYLSAVAPTGYSYGASSLMTSTIGGIPTWILLAGGGLGLILLLRARR